MSLHYEISRSFCTGPSEVFVFIVTCSYKTMALGVPSALSSLLPHAFHLSLCPQFSLFSEVRGLVTPQDLEHFDALVLRREIQALKARQGSSGAAALQQDSLSMVSYPDTLTSSSASCMTNTTLSSARVRPLLSDFPPFFR